VGWRKTSAFGGGRGEETTSGCLEKILGRGEEGGAFSGASSIQEEGSGKKGERIEGTLSGIKTRNRRS